MLVVSKLWSVSSLLLFWNSCEVELHSELIRIDELSRFAKWITELSIFIGFIIVISVDVELKRFKRCEKRFVNGNIVLWV